MIITNKYNLPQPFVEMAKSDYEYKDKQYSVTSLLKGVRQTILERRYHEAIEQDVSEMIWMLFGTAVHNILEAQKEGQHEFKEEYIRIPIGDYFLSGRIDLYDAKRGVLTDYKTCSVWKVIFADYEDWRQQLLMYAYLLHSIGFDVCKGEIVAMMKDHKKSEAKRKSDYPELPVKKITFNFTKEDFQEIEEWLKSKFEEIRKAEQLPDDELPMCTQEERWNDGDKYAVKRKGRKRALRVLGSREEAEKWMINNGGDYIEERPGEDRRCEDYCRVNKFCSHYRKSIQKGA